LNAATVKLIEARIARTPTQDDHRILVTERAEQHASIRIRLATRRISAPHCSTPNGLQVRRVACGCSGQAGFNSGR